MTTPNPPVPDALIAMMEAHCLQYREQYGHLRLDKLERLDPIPFPHRQMPGFFCISLTIDKNIKLWLQMEKTLFDYHEKPLGIPTYRHEPRQMGKATRAGYLSTLMHLDGKELGLMGAVAHDPGTDNFAVVRAELPPRADLDSGWNFVMEPGIAASRRKIAQPPGGHHDSLNDVDPAAGSFQEQLSKALRDMDFSRRPLREERIGLLGVGRSRLYDREFSAFEGIALERPRFRLSDYLRPVCALWDRMKVVEDPLDERCHSTDYPKKKGWYNIPYQVPCQAKPSPVVLALIKRSQ